MKTRTAACAALLAIAALTGCSSDTNADPAACKAALTKEMQDAVDSGKEGSRPDVCDGISDKKLEEIAGEVVGKELEDSLGDIDASLDDTLEDLETSAP
ncbi:hypothetical protein [Streptomyces sp. NBC_00299]|uniref:hypothetical protein n=1 Tax=Streptomyces sp. NBC_00299 TaxID=2975705 RepID=UPI002E2876E5|nr:hypothetical protein [Streptomyces sp. NBC_00299]